MPHFSHLPLQQAVYSRLSADATLMALVTGVYDFVPASAVHPYVTLGEMDGRDLSNAATPGMEFRFPVRVYMREAGRKQSATVMERIHALLHNAALTVTGQTLVGLRCESSDIMLLGDGATYRGTLRFRAQLYVN